MDRIDFAIDFMSRHQSFMVGDLRLGASNRNDIEVAGWSNCINLSELQEIKNTFFNMIQRSKNLKDFTIEKNIKYTLYYDDAGKASVTICTEENEVIEWNLSLQD